MKNSRSIGISRDEWFIIASITSSALILICLLSKIMYSAWFTSLIPPLQYLLFNLGFILLMVVFLGAPVSYVFQRKIHIWTMFRSGVGSWLLLSFILDLWQPPFAFGVGGQPLIPTAESLVGTSVDYMLGWTYGRIMPFQHVILSVPIIGKVSLLFLLVYFLTPIFAIFIAALLFKPKVLARLLWKDR